MTANPIHAGMVERLRAKTFCRWSSDVQAVEEFEDELASEAASFIESQTSRIEALEAENARLREALTPSVDTEAAYKGDFSFGVTLRAGNEEDYRRITVPWTTIKEIMAAIRARAAISHDRDEK